MENPKEEPKETTIDWSGFPKSTQEKVGYRESKQETLEGYEEALNQFPEYNQYLERIAFEKGVEWQAERSYNEDEVKKQTFLRNPNSKIFKINSLKKGEAKEFAKWLVKKI